MLRAVIWLTAWFILTREWTQDLVGALSTETQPNNCFITQEHQLSAAVNLKHKNIIKDINFGEIFKTLYDYLDSLNELKVTKSAIGGISVSDPLLCMAFGQFYPYSEVSASVTELISPRHYLLYPTYVIQYQENTAVCELDSQIGVLGQCRNTLVNIFKNQSFEIPNDCPIGKTCILGEGRSDLKYFPVDQNSYGSNKFYCKDGSASRQLFKLREEISNMLCAYGQQLSRLSQLSVNQDTISEGCSKHSGIVQSLIKLYGAENTTASYSQFCAKWGNLGCQSRVVRNLVDTIFYDDHATLEQLIKNQNADRLNNIKLFQNQQYYYTVVKKQEQLIKQLESEVGQAELTLSQAFKASYGLSVLNIVARDFLEKKLTVEKKLSLAVMTVSDLQERYLRKKNELFELLSPRKGEFCMDLANNGDIYCSHGAFILDGNQSSIFNVRLRNIGFKMSFSQVAAVDCLYRPDTTIFVGNNQFFHRLRDPEVLTNDNNTVPLSCVTAEQEPRYDCSQFYTHYPEIEPWSPMENVYSFVRDNKAFVQVAIQCMVITRQGTRRTLAPFKVVGVTSDEFPLIVNSIELTWQQVTDQEITEYFSKLSVEMDSLREHLKVPVIKPPEISHTTDASVMKQFVQMVHTNPVAATLSYTGITLTAVILVGGLTILTFCCCKRKWISCDSCCQRANQINRRIRELYNRDMDLARVTDTEMEEFGPGPSRGGKRKKGSRRTRH